MELRDIKFVEQYLYEVPKENYYRGISLYIDDILIISLDLEFNTYPVTPSELKDNGFWLRKDRAVLYVSNNGIIPRFIQKGLENIDLLEHKSYLLENKEEAKDELINIIKKYISIFIKD